MPEEGKKGITVRVDADLHAEVTQYLKSHGMTMSEFVTLALKEELHPTMERKEEKSMENMRTLAFQVPEELFLRIKDYLQRNNNMKQKDFVIGLIERELERDLAERQTAGEMREAPEAEEMNGAEHPDAVREVQTEMVEAPSMEASDEASEPGYQGGGEEEASEDALEECEAGSEDEEEAEEEGMGLSMGM